MEGKKKKKKKNEAVAASTKFLKYIAPSTKALQNINSENRSMYKPNVASQ